MFTRLKTLGWTLACALVSAPAFAQGDDWTFEGNFYLFAAETTTGIGNAEATLSFGDALENLDFAFLTAFSASKGPWTFIADYMLFDLSFESGTPGTDFSEAAASVKTQTFTGTGLYNVHSINRTKFDIGGGFRWFSTETKLDLSAGTSPATSRTEDDSWVDPIVAARVRFDIAENWTGSALIDYGGFIDDRDTWQFLLVANYALNDNWVARFGYRYFNVENDEDGQDYSYEQSGPVIGIAYRF